MKKITLVALLFCVVLKLFGQHEKADRLILYSENLKEKRTVWISLPQFYEENNYRCHVVYHLDAQEINQSNTIRTIRDELFENGGYIPPVILVGIEHKNRRTELSPEGERGIAFRKFLLEELIPFLDTTYRTYPDRIISGHSLGGNYALDLWRRGDTFKNCFAFSPAIYSNDNLISSQIAEYLKTGPKGFVYFNHGDQGTTETEILKVMPALRKAFINHKEKETDYLYKAYRGYGHNFTHLVGFTDAMLAYFGRFSPSDEEINALWNFELEPIAYTKNFHQQLESWLGFSYPADVDLVSNLISTYLQAGKNEKVLEMAAYILKLEPENPFVVWSAAEAYKPFDTEKSKDYYKKALTLFQPRHVFENTTVESTFNLLKEIMLSEYEVILEKE